MKRKGLIIFLILFIISSNIFITLAVSQTDLNNIQGQINETKEQMGEVKENLSGIMKEIQNLNAQITDYEQQITDLDVQIKGVEDKIVVAEEELRKAEEQYNTQKNRLEKRIVALYEAGETSFLDILLSSKDITDFITNYYLVSEIATYDTELLDQMDKNKTAIQEAKTVLENSKAEIEALKNNKVATANSLKDSQAVKQKYVDQLSAEEKELENKLNQLNEEQAAIQRQLKAAENKYSSEIANLGGTGTLQKPVSSGVITATWYYPSGGFHGALDYGIPVGTKVYAAEEGIVLYAGWSSGGYGNYVCIQHGNGLRTYYAHGCGTFYVSNGEKVSKGQLIMLSGNTGNSTGPHLHFEVRVSPYTWKYGGNDSRRDPRNYL